MTKRKKDKRTNNDIQNTTQKTNDRSTRIPINTGGELKCSGKGCRNIPVKVLVYV
jgi:hypothetical protein